MVSRTKWIKNKRIWKFYQLIIAELGHIEQLTFIERLAECFERSKLFNCGQIAFTNKWLKYLDKHYDGKIVTYNWFEIKWEQNSEFKRMIHFANFDFEADLKVT